MILGLGGIRRIHGSYTYIQMKKLASAGRRGQIRVEKLHESKPKAKSAVGHRWEVVPN